MRKELISLISAVVVFILLLKGLDYVLKIALNHYEFVSWLVIIILSLFAIALIWLLIYGIFLYDGVNVR